MSPTVVTTGRIDSSLTAPISAEDVPTRVDRLLAEAVAARASDLHLRPTGDGLEISWRRDGVLSPMTTWPKEWMANVVARLKVLAKLLTYRTELPQEGRLQTETPGVEMRLSTFPTLHGERAAIRIFGGEGQYLHIADLGLPEEIAGALTDHPFGSAEPKLVHVVFLRETPAPDEVALRALAQPGDGWHVGPRRFTLSTPGGYGTSKLAEKLPKLLPAPMTARNLRTIAALRAMLLAQP